MTEPVVIMAAPNGARRSRDDHPALPVTIPQIVETAAACCAAGAAALHLHIRDGAGGHLLDVGVYREAIAAIEARLGDAMAIQVTTESVGRYGPGEQMELVRRLRPAAVSIAVREIFADGEREPARFFAFAAEAGIAIQHIVYDVADLDRFFDLRRRGVVADRGMPRLILVAGRYSVGQESQPSDLEPLVARIDKESERPVWMACAFGRGETATLRAAVAAGGHARVGFENSLWHEDGSVAADNAERVAAIAGAVQDIGRRIADIDAACSVLGITR